MRNRRAGATVVALLATFAVCLLAACGGSDSDTTEGASSDSGSSSQGDLSGTTVSFVSFGGDLQEAQQAAWTDPVSEKTGLKVLQDGPTDYAKLRAQVESGNVTWDSIDADAFFVGAQCGKLFEPLDKSKVDLSAVAPDLNSNDCGVPVMQISWILVYDRDKFGDDPPTSFADFFDTAKYPGKRGVSTGAQVGVIEATLLGDGVAPADLYPLDVDRALKKLDTIKDDLSFYETGAQAAEQMLSKSFAMAIVPNGRAYEAVKNGAHFDAVWKDNIRSWDNIAIPKGRQNAGTQALLNYIATPPAQAALAERIAYGPTTPAAKPKIDNLLKSYLASTPANVKQSVPRDQAYWGENFDMVTERYTEWKTG